MKDAARHAKTALPIACNLSEPDLAKRRRELTRVVFGGALGVRDLEDGYEFVFPGSTGWATRLVELIDAERGCCPFFVFDLHLEPHDGRILLQVRGPEGTKEFIAAELGGPETGWTGTDAEPWR